MLWRGSWSNAFMKKIEDLWDKNFLQVLWRGNHIVGNISLGMEKRWQTQNISSVIQAKQSGFSSHFIVQDYNECVSHYWTYLVFSGPLTVPLISYHSSIHLTSLILALEFRHSLWSKWWYKPQGFEERQTKCHTYKKYSQTVLTNHTSLFFTVIICMEKISDK